VRFHHVAEVQLAFSERSSLVSFLARKNWVIDMKEFEESPGLYDQLEMPDEFRVIKGIWLIIPITHNGGLYGFVVLMEPRTQRQINWEDRDLLRTIAQQAGSYLALMKASESLSQASQFEAFNRLSAFVVHDLKNVLAQLELVVKNAEKHKTNPAFVDDAVNTVDNAAKKMGRLLTQLRKGRFESGGNQMISLRDVVAEAVREHSATRPEPGYIDCCNTDVTIVADRDRFVAVVGHMIKNAQEATHRNGFVRIQLETSGEKAIITIEDNGSGMSREFIRDRLFHPFETTKGNAGMGGGVYESRAFIRSLGGDVSVLSEVNQGTKFTLSLPIKKSDTDILDNSVAEA
jgi:putative PEP-CTERM system histidine kinase